MLRELGLGRRVKNYKRYVKGKYGHGFKYMTEEEVGEQMAKLEKCQEDPELLDRFKRYWSGLESYWTQIWGNGTKYKSLTASGV